MTTSKSRREIFEEQLKDLQKDISNLSSKLSIPPMVTATRLGSNSSILESSKSDLSMTKVNVILISFNNCGCNLYVNDIFEIGKFWDSFV